MDGIIHGIGAYRNTSLSHPTIMNLLPEDYHTFLHDLTARIRSAQYEALKAVNYRQLELYWYIGEQILAKQKTAGWGKSVVEQLSKDIQAALPGIRGFSARNLWMMRQWVEVYSSSEFLQPLVAEIGWSHHQQILNKCREEQEQEFYIRMTAKFGWTKDVLIHQIENKTYEKYLLNQTNFDQTLPEQYRHQAILAVKDEYQFGFLELADQHAERELELSIVRHIRAFLFELGSYFSFIGNQFRIEVGDKEYFVDLLLFHRKLNCLVAIDLKVGEFTPEMAGKMQFYLNALNDKVREDHENPAIGIIVCKSKNRMIVEYALRDSRQPIGVATYTINEQLPEQWKNLLPSPEQLEKHINLIRQLDQEQT